MSQFFHVLLLSASPVLSYFSPIFLSKHCLYLFTSKHLLYLPQTALISLNSANTETRYIAALYCPTFEQSTEKMKSYGETHLFNTFTNHCMTNLRSIDIAFHDNKSDDCPSQHNWTMMHQFTPLQENTLKLLFFKNKS